MTPVRDAGAGQTPLAAPRTPGMPGVPAGHRQPSGRGPNSPLWGSDSGPLSVSLGRPIPMTGADLRCAAMLRGACPAPTSEA